MPEKHRRSQDRSRAAWAGDIGAGPCHVKCEIAEKFTFFVKRFRVFSVLMTNAAAPSAAVNSAVRIWRATARGRCRFAHHCRSRDGPKERELFHPGGAVSKSHSEHSATAGHRRAALETPYFAPGQLARGLDGGRIVPLTGVQRNRRCIGDFRYQDRQGAIVFARAGEPLRRRLNPGPKCRRHQGRARKEEKWMRMIAQCDAPSFNVNSGPVIPGPCVTAAGDGTARPGRRHSKRKRLRKTTVPAAPGIVPGARQALLPRRRR
jgi:hypothetical protein